MKLIRGPACVAVCLSVGLTVSLCAAPLPACGQTAGVAVPAGADEGVRNPLLATRFPDPSVRRTVPIMPMPHWMRWRAAVICVIESRWVRLPCSVPQATTGVRTAWRCGRPV